VKIELLDLFLRLETGVSCLEVEARSEREDMVCRRMMKMRLGTIKAESESAECDEQQNRMCPGSRGCMLC
jgi:hypothetical protein